ncbi:hypothetical protein T03_36 [Trichinella britovi]|uniref:Uncharacterized protein n=1 Tax=Trichinella britovi TaxID=45882 RepID=A0A0V0YUF4_TRIBR|nr:hypothetical protein T03_36 [Trichinella britovi]
MSEDRLQYTITNPFLSRNAQCSVNGTSMFFINY